jgi:hypothetical protein
VSFTPPLLLFLASSWGSQPCQASAPWAREACSVHLAKVWPPASRAMAHALSVPRRARANAGRVLRSTWPVLGRAALACLALWSGHSRPSARCAHGPSSVSAQNPFKNKKLLFYFSFGFKLNSNFKNLYRNIQRSKNYETSSVGFIIF